jgi:sporulation protein YlmC with PRC-barrel domain
MNLVGDCLDKQLVDRNGHKMGRVDGIVIEVGEGRKPTVSAIKVGAACQASRLHRKLGGLVRSISKRCGVVYQDPYRLPWSKVVSAGIEVIAGVEAEKTPALAWELWLRKNIIARIPGA